MPPPLPKMFIRFAQELDEAGQYDLADRVDQLQLFDPSEVPYTPIEQEEKPPPDAYTPNEGEYTKTDHLWSMAQMYAKGWGLDVQWGKIIGSWFDKQERGIKPKDFDVLFKVTDVSPVLKRWVTDGGTVDGMKIDIFLTDGKTTYAPVQMSPQSVKYMPIDDAKKVNASLPANDVRHIMATTMKNKPIIPNILTELIPDVVAVGGCVRDALMGNEPNDIDLATSMRPENILKTLENAGIRAIPTGLDHGTITAVIDEEPYEITTFRVDTNTDGRRADVEFVNDLTQDLARRDFTINAMAMRQSGEIIDPFGGQDDLRQGVIRTVGDPNDRFSEDLLRIIRAARFASRFGFDIAPKTAKTMMDKSPELISAIEGGPVSIERVVMEFDKAFKGDNPSQFLDVMWDTGVFQHLIPEMDNADDLMQNPQWHPEGSVWNHMLEVVDRAPPKYRWHALFHDIGKCISHQPTENEWKRFYGHAHTGADVIEDVGRRLKLPMDLINSIQTTTAEHMARGNVGEEGPTRRMVRRLQHRTGPHLDALEAVMRADAGDKWHPAINELFDPVEEQNYGITPALMGRHLIERGHNPGPHFGPILDRALEYQLDTGETDVETLYNLAIKDDTMEGADQNG